MLVLYRGLRMSTALEIFDGKKGGLLLDRNLPLMTDLWKAILRGGGSEDETPMASTAQ